MNFVEINQQWLQYIFSCMNASTLLRVDDIVRGFLRSYDGEKLLTPPVPLLFDENEYAELSSVCHALLSAQTKIVNHLVQTKSKEELLSFFNVDVEMEALIDWAELVQGDKLVVRFDVIPSNDQYYVCEINVDSSIGGGDAFDLAELFFKHASLPYQHRLFSPNYDKARLVGRLYRRESLNRIVILGWHSYEGDGYSNFELEKAYFKALLPDVSVEIYHEYNYPEAYLNANEGASTLVYRIGVFEDMTDRAKQLFKQIMQSGSVIVNTFENEIRMSKKWLSIFCEPQYHSLLNQDELNSITHYVPHTFGLDQHNLSRSIKDKNDYVFKYNQSYGGTGIVIGAEVSAKALTDMLNEHGQLTDWSVQKVIKFDGIAMPYDRSMKHAKHSVVFGIYLIDGQCKGVMVRASRKSKLVNVSSDPETLTFCAPPVPLDYVESLCEEHA